MIKFAAGNQTVRRYNNSSDIYRLAFPGLAGVEKAITSFKSSGWPMAYGKKNNLV